MFAIVDCNNFYASCERLFRPDLRNKPIVVLSNNDGCVIARSNEAKVLGVGMAEPYFKVKDLCRKHKMYAFSSNYTLYGNISHRVMLTIEESWPEVEIYSIDEAFVDLATMSPLLRLSFCNNLQQRILKNVGIPTSIGIGATKTLAKAANFLAKKVLKTAVFQLDKTNLEMLQQVPITEVWGIGRKWSAKLIRQNVLTAFDLANVNAHQFKKQFSVVMMRTVMELQGTRCAILEDTEPRQNIMSSKSFGQMQTDFQPIAEAISSHCARAVEKLRNHHLVAKKIWVFVHTNRYRLDLHQHFQGLELNFINPTDDLRLITKMAKQALKRIYKPGHYYKKVGVCLEELIAKNPNQLDLFHQPSDNDLDKTERLMTTFDAINTRYGRSTVRLAAEGYSKPWSMKAELKSPAYTTCWTQLAKVVIG